MNTQPGSDGTTAPFAVVSVDVGGTKIAGGVLEYRVPGEKPEIVLRGSVPTDALEGGDAVMGRITALINALVGDYGKPVAAAGVATTGRVCADTGKIGVVLAENIMPGWSNQPVREKVEKACGLPCAVLNDVQGHALGEARWGGARGCSNCIVAAPGTGLGGSFIVDGKLVRGARGFAGEIGHTVSSRAAGIPCPCGGEGHLESVASGSGIEARYAVLGGEPLTGPEISERAYAGDELAKRVIEDAGLALGESIASWANMFDPELVLLSGSVLKAGPLWFDALKRGISSQMSAVDDLPLAEATLGGDAPLYGAAEHACDSFNLR